MRNRISVCSVVSAHGIQNAQGISLSQLLHQVVVAVGVDMEQVQPAGEDHTHLRQKVSVPDHDGPLWVGLSPGLHGLQHLQDLCVLHIAKQQALFQNAKESPFFHFMVTLLFYTFSIKQP